MPDSVNPAPSLAELRAAMLAAEDEAIVASNAWGNARKALLFAEDQRRAGRARVDVEGWRKRVEEANWRLDAANRAYDAAHGRYQAARADTA
jgi:hypothetical protein